MRLLMVGPVQGVAMQRHINWAVEQGIQVQVADLKIPERISSLARFDLIRLWPRRAYSINQSRLHRSSSYSIHVGALRLRAIAKSFQPHVIHSFMISHYSDMCLQAGLRPLIVSAWSALNGLMAPGIVHKERLHLRKVRAGADVLLVENPNLLTALARFATEPLLLDCFPIGVDSHLFHPDHQEKAAAWRFVLDIPDQATVLLSPRGWSRLYGQQHIMRAFAEVYRQLDKPLVLIFMGLGRMKRPEALAQEILDLGASLGVSHAIRWIPQIPQQEMPGVYALADIVVNYPRSDAFPSTLLEAAACARPVITSDLPAYRNTFVERFCRLVEPENSTALAEAMVELIAACDTAGWAARVEQARQAVLAEHEERIQKARLMALYQAIADKRV